MTVTVVGRPGWTDETDVPFLAQVRAEAPYFVWVGFFGELDVAAYPRADAALREAEGMTVGTVVVDLSELRFLDGSGVHLLSESVRRMDGRLVVLRGPIQVQRVFDLTDADHAAVPFAD